MPEENLIGLTATETARLIKNGELKVVELAQAYIEQIQAHDPAIHAFADFDPDYVLKQAARLDLEPPPRRGHFFGIPIAIKESFDVAGLRCAWGTPIHRERRPNEDAEAIKPLREAGAVILGTTTCTEYTIAAAPPTVNPHDHARTPGGSSTGSAAAVAALMAPIALGTQAVGSTIRPANYCGVYGLKPTHGAISTLGVMSLSPLLDHIGILARSPEDIALAYRVLFGRDTDTTAPVIPDLGKMAIPHRAYRVDGPLRERVEPPSHIALTRAQTALSAAGVLVLPTELPTDFENAPTCLDVILCRDIAVNHGKDRDRAGDQMSQQLRNLVDRGRKVSDTEYATATDGARRYRESLLKLLGENSIILAPATDSIAPLLAEGTGSPDLQGLYSLTGLPAIAVPCGNVYGLPVGVQLVAAPGCEELLFATAHKMRSAVKI